MAVETAAAATEGGYAIEARLPWANLGIDPEEGLETAFQLYVNDRDGEGPTFGLAWYPRREAHTDPSAMHRVRLADSASSSVVAAAAGKYDKLRRIVVQARGVADSAGARVEVRDGDIVVADESLTLTDGRAAATLTLPMPAIGAPRPNLSVNIAGAHTADLDLPDADGLRARELTEAELHFHPSVFASDDFPGCDFEESRRVESLIGPYT
ncbi:hypothetical protein HN937_24735, partial [Candidatus Poribacteria bacterium]|nr:hypothetical protein [Candidatus Poribacteria bacterium]